MKGTNIKNPDLVFTQSEPVGDEEERVQIFSPRRAWTITWTVCRYKKWIRLKNVNLLENSGRRFKVVGDKERAEQK